VDPEVRRGGVDEQQVDLEVPQGGDRPHTSRSICEAASISQSIAR
jgi:hypothetical protein